jgi:hypothetical protein
LIGDEAIGKGERESKGWCGGVVPCGAGWWRSHCDEIGVMVGQRMGGGCEGDWVWDVGFGVVWSGAG